jgi:hypothetical protein
VAWFNPASSLPARVVDPDIFFPALIRAMFYEMRRIGNEPWYADIIAELQAQPLFAEYWRKVAREPFPTSSGRALIPLRLRAPANQQLAFRLASESFMRDARFRTIDFFPADQTTLQWCAASPHP